MIDGIPADYFIKCNGDEVHINDETEQLDGEWGGEQCEGCGADIIEHGHIIDPLQVGARVKCDECGATYDVRLA